LFDELILTLHPHGCLTLYPDKRFRELEEKMASMSNIGYFESHLQEVLIGCAEPLSFDGSGRFKVSPHLRQRANLRREALLFGVGDCIRIWDEERWEQRNLLMTARLQDDGISETWRQLNI
jgi:MraZ protein